MAGFGGLCSLMGQGSISKCGDRRVRTLLYEPANVMLTRYKPALKLKDWAFAIAKRSERRLCEEVHLNLAYRSFL